MSLRKLTEQMLKGSAAPEAGLVDYRAKAA